MTNHDGKVDLRDMPRLLVESRMEAAGLRNALKAVLRSVWFIWKHAPEMRTMVFRAAGERPPLQRLPGPLGGRCYPIHVDVTAGEYMSMSACAEAEGMQLADWLRVAGRAASGYAAREDD